MLFSTSNLLGLPIYEIRNQSRLGIVSDIIFTDDLKIIALALEKGFLGEQEALFTDEVVEIAQNAIIVNEDKSVSKLKENIRLEGFIKNNQFGLKHTIVTPERKVVGKSFDLVFSKDTFQIVRIISKTVFSERVFEKKQIKGFRDNCFVVEKSDNLAKVKMEPGINTA